jgi:hypothetical protein
MFWKSLSPEPPGDVLEFVDSGRVIDRSHRERLSSLQDFINGGFVSGGYALLTPGCNLSSRWDLKNEPHTRGCHFHPEGIYPESLKG